MDPGTPDIAVPFSSSASDRPGGAATAQRGGYDNSSSGSPQPLRSATRACSATHSRHCRRACRLDRLRPPASMLATPNTPPAVATIGRLSGGASAPGTGLDRTKCRRAV